MVKYLKSPLFQSAIGEEGGFSTKINDFGVGLSLKLPPNKRFSTLVILVIAKFFKNLVIFSALLTFPFYRLELISQDLI